MLRSLSKAMKISLCIPMYNESKVIANTAKTLYEYMTETFGKDNFEVIFSDDGSKDGSFDIVESLGLDNIRCIRTEQNFGKGSAVRHAMLNAEGDVVMFTDADLAYGTDVIGGFQKYMEEHPEADCLIGSRNISKDGYEGYTLVRKLASKMYIKLLCIVGGFKLSDSQCGCKAFRNAAAKRIFEKAEVNGFAFDFEAILLANKFKYKIHEFPVKVINHGESKVHVLSDTFKMLSDLRKMRKRINKADF